MRLSDEAALVLQVNPLFLKYKIRAMVKTNTKMSPTHIGTTLFLDDFPLSGTLFAPPKRKLNYILSILVESS